MNNPFYAPTLFLYGPPATGKSTCARLLAEALGKSLIDIDAVIAKRANKTIAEIFADDGEGAFRALETCVIKELCATVPNAVIALGGGALLRDENRICVEATGVVILLTASIEELIQRASRRPHARPLADTTAHFKQLLLNRKAHYDSFPITILNNASTTPKETVWNIQLQLGRFNVTGMGTPYNVTVGRGTHTMLSSCIASLTPCPTHILLIGDSNTMPLYGQSVLKHLTDQYICSTHTIPAGEEHKTFTTVTQLWETMSSSKIERNDLVIALGGGVVGDLTGFASATWLRGVRWLNLPTSLLAMVDAGIGGKTGADLPQGKNLIGAFHPPCAVISDTDTLATLPPCEISCGLSESYKHALIGDPSLRDLVLAYHAHTGHEHADLLTALTIRSVAVKVQTICQDPFERTGKRVGLNLGHTLGHAVEAASHFTIKHGEAVAIGMNAAARLAVALKLCPPALQMQIKQDLLDLGLPVDIPATCNQSDILEAMSHDKKKEEGSVRFVLPIRYGEVRSNYALSQTLIHSVL